MDIENYIKEYKIGIGQEPWFQDIWFPFYYKKDVLITKNVIKFIYGIESNEEKFRTYLIKNSISFKLIDYFDEIYNDYPYLEVDKRSWIKLTKKNFLDVIILLNNKKLKEYTDSINDLITRYSLYLLEHKSEIDLKKKIVVLEKENNELKNKFRSMADFFVKRGNLEPKQIFYIATSNIYSQENIFKIGGVEDLSLLEKKKDFFFAALFQTHDYRLIEHFLSSFLSNFRLFESDLYKINFDDLLDIVIDFVNSTNGYVAHFNFRQPTLVANLFKTKEIKENMEIRNYNGVWINQSNLKEYP